MQDIGLVIAFSGLLVFLAHLFIFVFDRTRVPDVLFLVAIGIVLGPIMKLVSPSQFGEVGPVFTTVTLIIILFQAGTAMKLTTLGSILGRSIGLASMSFFLTMGITVVIGVLFMKLELIPALILGAILGSTSESVIIPLAKQLKLREDSQAIISLETSVNDVLSIVIVVALVTAYQLGQFSFMGVASKLVSSFVVAIVLGVLTALVWTILHSRVHVIKESMLATPAFVFIVYGLAELLGYNGAIASLAFGVTTGNIEVLRLNLLKKLFAHDDVGLTPTERSLFSEIAFVLKTFFFVFVGISLQLNSRAAFILGAVLMLAAFALRIPAVRVSLGKSTPVRDAAIIATMIPKGLAAVALASLPFTAGISGGEQIMNVTYAAVLLSMAMTSALVVLLDKTKLAYYYGRMVSPGDPELSNGKQSAVSAAADQEASAQPGPEK